MPHSIPEGFVDPQIGGLAGNLGPIYRKDLPDRIISGSLIAERHCNPGNICHGGWLSTVADVAMVRQGALVAKPLVTISLTVDFLDAVHLGEWMEAHCEVIRHTKSMVFLQGMVHVGARPVLRMNGIFRILRPRD